MLVLPPPNSNVISHDDAVPSPMRAQGETDIKQPMAQSPTRTHHQPPCSGDAQPFFDKNFERGTKYRRIPSRAMAQLLVMVSDLRPSRLSRKVPPPCSFLFSFPPKRLPLTPLINGSFQCCAPLHGNQSMATRGSSKRFNIASSGAHRSAKFTSNVETPGWKLPYLRR
jgi:hypothetical protein